ncbi:hypothetical protein [Arthrobacter sp. ISL-28]|uniref:hypothetical protein n=1 Tax=Arthrobacter sp. ISL-28 TaxID=2819108 RepID=UPI001BE7754D|nr:hypothetical protein [Arthrobacter sp. ISL-28]MBT2523268.1 hypothetical protein [Arthrobacter sp. ISL-28]
MAHVFNCQICGSTFEASRVDAVQCSQACRQSAFRARQAVVSAHNAAAADLLRRQTAALSAGADPVALAAIAREAETLFADV